jgi:hypothetical protein
MLRTDAILLCEVIDGCFPLSYLPPAHFLTPQISRLESYTVVTVTGVSVAVLSGLWIFQMPFT